MAMGSMRLLVLATFAHGISGQSVPASASVNTQAPTIFVDPTKGRCYCSPKPAQEKCKNLVTKNTDNQGNVPSWEMSGQGKIKLGKDFDVNQIPEPFRSDPNAICQTLQYTPAKDKDGVEYTPPGEREDFVPRVLKFCNMVDYKFLLMDLDDTYGNDTFAGQMYENFQKALALYNCYGSESEETSSSSKSVKGTRRWTCKDCREAYKNWLCAALFRRCHIPNPEVQAELAAEGTELPVEQQGKICQNVTNDFCPLGVTYGGCTYRTCTDVCYKFVRNCPVHLHFKCPPLSDEREYTNSECNSITTNPQPSKTFGTTSIAKLESSPAATLLPLLLSNAFGAVLVLSIGAA